MKEFLNNLFSTRRMAFWLNLLGLSLAFVVFYVLMAEVKWVHGFDRFHDGAERICRVDSKGPSACLFNGHMGYTIMESCKEAVEAAVDFKHGHTWIPSQYEILD
ncbi:MAG: hypothetical protein IKB96_02975, partial [Prevotella sp.]|nr:hypothetical protein [Prevotella sp.]